MTGAASIERPSPRVLTGLQYVRATAALLVVLDHISSMAALPNYFGLHMFGGAFEVGTIGVEVFFVVSGFIMVYIALDADLRPTKPLARFLLERFARIAPFLWVSIALYAALRIAGRGTFPWENYAAAAFLVPGRHLEPNVVWTLRHEALFYLIFGLTYLWRLPRVLLWAWVASPAALYLLGVRIPVDDSLMALIFGDVNTLFGLGILCAALFLKVRAKSSLAWLAAPATAFLIGAGWALSYNSDSRGIMPHVLCLGAISAAIVYLSAVAGPAKNILVKAFKFLGDASYSIYLTHSIVISAMLGVMRSHHVGFAVVLVSIFVASVAFGVLVHRLIERPLVRLVQQRLRAMASTPPVPARSASL